MHLLWLIFLPAMAYQLLSLAASLRQFFRAKPAAGFTPPVSILKPVHGLDPGMYAAFVSQAQQDYPDFELLFGAADAGDAAIPEIQRLQQEFPGVSIRLFIGAEPAANGKVGVLLRLAREARNPIWVVNDSDIGVTPGYVREVVAPLADDADAAGKASGGEIGLVTCLYRPKPHSLPAAWEALGIAVDFMPSTLVAPLVGVREFGLGSTLAFRAADFERAGGFAAVADYLADDYQLARRITSLGKRALLSTCIVETSLGDTTWSGVWRHQLRWARTIRASKGGGYAGLPLTHAGLWAIAALACGLWPVAVALGALRVAAALAAGWLVIRLDQPVVSSVMAPLWDLYAFGIWLASYASNEVRWRDHSLRIGAGGRILATVPPRAPEQAPHEG